MSPSTRRAALYARVSTLDQEPENQLAELRRYVAARDWLRHAPSSACGPGTYGGMRESSSHSRATEGQGDERPDHHPSGPHRHARYPPPPRLDNSPDVTLRNY